MKVLKGTLRETRYSHPEEKAGPQVIQSKEYTEGQVTYMSDELGLHRIGNVSKTEDAVSLHRK